MLSAEDEAASAARNVLRVRIKAHATATVPKMVMQKMVEMREASRRERAGRASGLRRI